ncbi:MAG: methionine--tRNA ligase [Clostridiales bacterium]|jgi:methionyl-tRNA synthetase|nr:methionine--tRNA ligase [Clostridiales bacterium]
MMNEKDTFYITTALFYSNSYLHVGHAHEIVAADAMARYKRLRGFDVKFLTGMDEHGQKIEQAAQAAGRTPQEHVDYVAESVRELMRNLGADYDIFWRTTDPAHIAAVRKIFNRLYEQGDIYKGAYRGLYCTPCETFYTPRQLAAGRCPVCEREVCEIDEEAYFFKIGKYGQRLIEHIEQNPEFIMPKSRANEMLNNFLRPGLEDLCVSRTSFKWGVPVDFDPGHVVYVWVDALSNYAIGLGFMSDDDTLYKKYWPADVHIVGKDIVRFHTIIWPAILMALGQPLPKQVFGHGWVNIDGKKIGKSLGNAVDPNNPVATYGADAIRYFLLKEIVFGQDGNFSIEALVNRINSDLANDLGNLLSRTVGMVDKYFGGELPAEQAATDFDEDLRAVAARVAKSSEEHYDRMEFDQALAEIWTLIRRANKYIDQVEPWKLVKEEGKRDALAGSLYNLVEVLRIAAILIEPIMPGIPARIYEQLNIQGGEWSKAHNFGLAPKEIKVTKGNALFPRIDNK